MRLDFVLVIPCYQEARNLPKTLGAIRRLVGSEAWWTTRATAIVFVDDGSSDATASLLEQAVGANWPIPVTLVRLQKNMGKGRAIMAGVNSLSARRYGFTDADLAYDLALIPVLYQRLDEVDLVMGERTLEKVSGYRWDRNIISRATRWATRVILGLPYADTQCGLKLFRSTVVEHIFSRLTLSRFVFDVELIARAKVAGLRIATHAVTQQPTQGSSLRLGDGFRFLSDVLAVFDGEGRLAPDWKWRMVGWCVGLSLLLFGWTVVFAYPFSDDFTWYWFGKAVAANPTDLFRYQSAHFFSPVTNAYFALLHTVFGFFPPAFFLANLLIHIINSVLLGVLTYALSRSRLAAWFAAGIFSVAGSAYEPLVWLAASQHSLATLWILLALVQGWRLFTTGAWKPGGLMLLAILLAYSTKEISAALPFLLGVLLALAWATKQLRRTWAIACSISGALALSLYYAKLQLHLATFDPELRAAQWVIHPQALLRLPFVIMDLFIPLQGLAPTLDEGTAVVLELAFIALIGAVWFTYRRLPLTTAAPLLILSAALPTLFFTQPHWWLPLDSRYTYLPRVGSSLLLGVLLAYIIRHATVKRYVGGTFLILLGTILLQTSVMIQTVQRQYGYVYQTGRTLAHAATLLRKERVQRVYVHAEHPFRGNDAHLLGALIALADVPEERIELLPPAVDGYPQQDGSWLLYWNPEARQYELTTKSFPYHN